MTKYVDFERLVLIEDELGELMMAEMPDVAAIRLRLVKYHLGIALDEIEKAVP